ncbi:hypothetical protein TGGT1_222150 [Toxoplasma gondii GT1]|uniref:Uncharacterized protein n=2 Tax=Toxoplasma gondii TaxID=5811 RepID=S7UK79_TOXGG|nr:hypothetical protein TGGT1_222150 [Toxoplasma gondii GT1]KAF4645631.1 hypothetical protein TGRH88_001170 [Toxoplasma gondii]
MKTNCVNGSERNKKREESNVNGFTETPSDLPPPQRTPTRRRKLTKTPGKETKTDTASDLFDSEKMPPFSPAYLFSTSTRSASKMSLALLRRRWAYGVSTFSSNLFSLCSVTAPSSSALRRQPPRKVPVPFASQFPSSAARFPRSHFFSLCRRFFCTSVEPSRPLRCGAQCSSSLPGESRQVRRFSELRDEEDEEAERLRRSHADSDSFSTHRTTKRDEGDRSGGDGVRRPVRFAISAGEAGTSLREADRRRENDSEKVFLSQRKAGPTPDDGEMFQREKRAVDAARVHAVRDCLEAARQGVDGQRENCRSQKETFASSFQVDVLLGLLEGHTRAVNEAGKREACSAGKEDANQTSVSDLNFSVPTPRCGTSSCAPSAFHLADAFSRESSSRALYSLPSSSPSSRLSAPSVLTSPLSSSSVSSSSLSDASAETVLLPPAFLLHVMQALDAKSADLSLSHLLRLSWILASLRLQNVASPSGYSPVCSSSPVLDSSASSHVLPLLWGARRRLIDGVCRRLHSVAWPATAAPSPFIPQASPGASSSHSVRRPCISSVSVSASSVSLFPSPSSYSASSLARSVSAISKLLDPRTKERFPLVLSLFLPRLLRLFASQIETEVAAALGQPQQASAAQPSSLLSASSPSLSPSPCPSPSSLAHSYSAASPFLASAEASASKKQQTRSSSDPSLSSSSPSSTATASPSSSVSPSSFSPLHETQNILASPPEASSFLFALVFGGCARLNLRPCHELLLAFARVCIPANGARTDSPSYPSVLSPFSLSALSSDSTQTGVCSRSSTNVSVAVSPSSPSFPSSFASPSSLSLSSSLSVSSPSVSSSRSLPLSSSQSSSLMLPPSTDSDLCMEGSRLSVRDLSLLLLSLARVEASVYSSLLLQSSMPLLYSFFESLLSPEEFPHTAALPSASPVSPRDTDAQVQASCLNLANLLTASALHAQTASEVNLSPGAYRRRGRRHAAFSINRRSLSSHPAAAWESLLSSFVSPTLLSSPRRGPSPGVSSLSPRLRASAASWRLVAVGCLHACASLARGPRIAEGDQKLPSEIATGKEIPNPEERVDLRTGGASGASTRGASFSPMSRLPVSSVGRGLGAEGRPLAASLERQVTICCLAFSSLSLPGCGTRHKCSRKRSRLPIPCRLHAFPWSSASRVLRRMRGEPRKGATKAEERACWSKRTFCLRRGDLARRSRAVEKPGPSDEGGVSVQEQGKKTGRNVGRARQRSNNATGNDAESCPREAKRRPISPLFSACSTETLAWLVGLLRRHYGSAEKRTAETLRAKSLPRLKGTCRDGQRGSFEIETERERNEQHSEFRSGDASTKNSEGRTACRGRNAGDATQREEHTGNDRLEKGSGRRSRLEDEVLHTLADILPSLRLSLPRPPTVSASGPCPSSSVSFGAQRVRESYFVADLHESARASPSVAYEVFCGAPAYPYTVDILLRGERHA